MSSKEYMKGYGARYYQLNKAKLDARSARWRINNPQKVLAWSAEYKFNNKDKVRTVNLKCKYGIDAAQFDEILKQQNFRCAICGISQAETNRYLCVDHCHRSKKVRGLLCTRCNAGIGNFKESTENLLKAINYVRSHA